MTKKKELKRLSVDRNMEHVVMMCKTLEYGSMSVSYPAYDPERRCRIRVSCKINDEFVEFYGPTFESAVEVMKNDLQESCKYRQGRFSEAFSGPK